jgi:ribose transport system permease protein
VSASTLDTRGGAALPAHHRGLAARLAAAIATPGGAVYVLAVLLLVLTVVANPNFGEPRVLMNFLGRAAPIAIAAIGQYYVIVSGEFDLSMGAVIGTQVVLAGNLIGEDPDRIVPVTVLMLLVGAGVGFVNGVVTTILKVPSFIVTLGTMLALGGLVSYITGGAATGNPVDEFREVGRGRIEGVPVVEFVPYPVIILVVVAVAASWLMRRPFGRNLLAAGDNAPAAQRSGSSLWWLKTRAFMLASLAATVSGILLVGYAGVHPSVGDGYEFTAITAVVLGGVLLGGGRGWVLSAAAGAIALELLFTLLTVQEIESTWRDTVQGLIIIAAVAVAARGWQAGRRPSLSSRSRTSATSSTPHPTPPVTGTNTGDT